MEFDRNKLVKDKHVVTVYPDTCRKSSSSSARFSFCGMLRQSEFELSKSLERLILDTTLHLSRRDTPNNWQNLQSSVGMNLTSDIVEENSNP